MNIVRKDFQHSKRESILVEHRNQLNLVIPNLQPVPLLKLTIRRLMTFSQPRFAWNDRKPSTCAITGSKIALNKSNSPYIGQKVFSIVPTISLNIFLLLITNRCDTSISRKFTLCSPTASLPTREGVFLCLSVVGRVHVASMSVRPSVNDSSLSIHDLH